MINQGLLTIRCVFAADIFSSFCLYSVLSFSFQLQALVSVVLCRIYESKNACRKILFNFIESFQPFCYFIKLKVLVSTVLSDFYRLNISMQMLLWSRSNRKPTIICGLYKDDNKLKALYIYLLNPV